MRRNKVVVEIVRTWRARSFARGATMMIALGQIVLLVSVLHVTTATAASAPKKQPAEGSSSQASKPLAELQATGPLAAQYCAAARDTVAEARFAQQAAELERLAKDADDRLSQLDKRSAELKEWIAKRDEFIASATKHLVAIFGAMRPESASEQLVRLDVSTAAAILSRLDVRAASAILNDMPPEKAARLTAVIAGSARKDSQEKP